MRYQGAPHVSLASVRHASKHARVFWGFFWSEFCLGKSHQIWMKEWHSGYFKDKVCQGLKTWECSPSFIDFHVGAQTPGIHGGSCGAIATCFQPSYLLYVSSRHFTRRVWSRKGTNWWPHSTLLTWRPWWREAHRDTITRCHKSTHKIQANTRKAIRRLSDWLWRVDSMTGTSGLG